MYLSACGEGGRGRKEREREGAVLPIELRPIARLPFVIDSLDIAGVAPPPLRVDGEQVKEKEEGREGRGGEEGGGGRRGGGRAITWIHR